MSDSGCVNSFSLSQVFQTVKPQGPFSPDFGEEIHKTRGISTSDYNATSQGSNKILSKYNSVSWKTENTFAMVTNGD